MLKVGTYSFYGHNIDLYLRDGWGAELDSRPTDDGLPRIVIGAAPSTWGEVLGCLLHEAQEFAYIYEHGRFTRSDAVAEDSAGYIFMFDHRQFSEATARVGLFVAWVEKDLKRAWKKYESRSK